MLKDEPLEYIQEQFDEKNSVLEKFGEQVDAWCFYDEVFGDMDLVLPVVILDEEAGKKIQPMELGNAIDFSMCRNDVLLGGVSYFNNWISKQSARELYTIIIDMDNVYAGTLLNALENDWRSANDEPFAKPTYIVNSGTGLHLYFVLDEPIPCYKRSLQDIDTLYRELAVQQSRRVYVDQQVQWFGQDFRMAGGHNKYGWENTVFRVGEKWNIDELARAVGIDTHFVRYGEPRQKPLNTPVRRVRKSSSGWHTNPAFYYYALENCREKTKEGHRYMSMCALTVIAWKCNVPKEEVEHDLLELLPEYNKGATREVKVKEVYSALKMYNEKAMLTQRRSLESWQGWDYSPPDRNYRKQREHLHAEYWINEKGRPSVNLCKQNRELALSFMRENGEIKGRPSGSGTARRKVKEWREQNPDGKKADCVRDTGLSKPTVYKWWE